MQLTLVVKGKEPKERHRFTISFCIIISLSLRCASNVEIWNCAWLDNKMDDKESTWHLLVVCN